MPTYASICVHLILGQALDAVHAAVLTLPGQLQHGGGRGEQEGGVRAHQEDQHH
jgi:hypothetical protein